MSKKILFIEDEMRLQEALGAKLRMEGYDMISALDGDSGLKMAEEQHPDLILLDLILPKKSGFEVMEEMRSDPQMQSSEPPIIIISNLGQDTDIARGKELGAIEYFVKSNISVNDLVKHIRDYLSHSERSSQITPV